MMLAAYFTGGALALIITGCFIRLALWIDDNDELGAFMAEREAEV